MTGENELEISTAEWSSRSGLKALRVGTWNILAAFWDSLEARTLEAVEHLRDCDVLLIQEAAAGTRHDAIPHPDAAAIIADALGMTIVSRGYMATRDDGRTFSNAILTSLPASRVSAVEFDAVPTQEFAVASIVVGEQAVVFVSAHLSWGAHLEHLRLDQARQINRHVKLELSRHPAGTLAIIGGDFNTDPDSATSRFFTGKHVTGDEAFWVDAWAQAGEGPGYTQTPENIWARATANSVGIADPAQLPNRRIDYLYSHGWVYGKPGAPLAAEVRGRLPKTGIHASDHMAVVADFATVESIRDACA